MQVSRLFGVAPLAVFFDATGTRAQGTERPFHDLEFRWDFGDPQSGRWRPTDGTGEGRSRNAALGAVAAHVFEKPGLYPVSLAVTDGSHEASVRCAGITVLDPEQAFAGDKTACFSNSQDFTGCPAGAARIRTASFGEVTQAASPANLVRRLLLRRGHSFEAAVPGALVAPGPGLLGAFGPASEPPPVVHGTHADGILALSSGSTPAFRDWRVVDLQLDGRKAPASKGVRAAGGASQVTLLRLGIRDAGSGIQFSSFLLDHWNGPNGRRPGHALWDQITVADATIRDLHDGAGTYLSAMRFAYLGNVVEDFATGSGHILRLPYVAKAVVSNNRLSRPTLGLQVIKLHAPCTAGEGCPGVSGVEGRAASELIVISDNELTGATGTSWSVTLGPQSPRYEERVRDVVFERNWMKSGAGHQVALVVNGSEITVRNNLCDLSGATDGVCFDVFQRGPHSPPPEHVRLYHNSAYGNVAAGFTFANFRTPLPSARRTDVRNNIAFAPRAAGRHLLREPAGGVPGLVQASNLLAETSPFAAAAPSLPRDYRLAAGSRGRAAGAALPVFSDYFGAARPKNVNFDLGAAAGP